MTTVVVHDSAHLEPAAFASAPPGVVHAVASGSQLPPHVDAGRVFRFANPKDPDFLDALMRWLDGALETLAIPELELARYRLLLDLADQEHRWWVLRLIADTLKPSQVVLYRASGPFARALDHGLQLQARTLGIAVRWRAGVEGAASVRQRVSEALFPHWDHARRTFKAASTRREAPARGAVVFPEHYPNSVQVLLPVERALLQLGASAPTWLATRREVSAALTRTAAPALGLESLLGPLEFARAGAVPALLLARLESALVGLPTFCLAGAERLVHAGALAMPFAEAAMEAHRWRVLARAALEKLRPSVITSTTYSSIQGRAFALAAHELSVPSVFVQHGSYPDRYVWSHFLHDQKLMWGEFARQSLLKHGHSPETVHALGPPHHDAFAVAAAERPWARPVGRPWRIVYMASRSGGMVVSADAARRTLRAVVEAVGQLPNAELVVKAHPGDSTQIPEEETRERPKVRLQRSGSSLDLILESDVVIVASSTTGFEACVARRPLIELNLTGLAESAEYAAAGAAIAVREPAALVGTLKSLADPSGPVDGLLDRQRKLVDHYLTGADGHASRRVAEFIQHLAMRAAA